MAEVDGQAAMGEVVMEALGCPQRELAGCFGDSDDALSHTNGVSPEVKWKILVTLFPFLYKISLLEIMCIV